MRNVRRRLHVLERLPQHRASPSQLEQVTSLALQSLSDQDLKLLSTARMGRRELSEEEAAACRAWEEALEVEARRIGLKFR